METEKANMARVGKIGRNQPCPCGSGKKFKKCCGSVVGRLVKALTTPAPTMPDPMTFEELQDRIRQLKSIVARYDTLSILMSCTFTIQKIDWEHPERAGMMAPYKQCTYIASLALATPGTQQKEHLTSEKWGEICELSGEIFGYYVLAYFRQKTVQAARESKEKRVKTFVAMVAFLYGLSTGVNASVEQIRDDINTLYSPFDAEVALETGLTVQDFVDISNFIVSLLERRFSEGIYAIYDTWMEFRKQCEEGIDPPVAVDKAKEKLGDHNFTQFDLSAQVTLAELQKAFPAKNVANYLAFVSQARASADADFFFPTEEHLIEQKPLVLVRPDTYHLISGNLLFLSILRGLEALLRRDRNVDVRFNRHKGKILESCTLHMFREIFGEEASYFEGLYETDDAHNEHDILILYKDNLFIVECKAKGIRKNFRDVERATDRITSDFKSYIQEGFDQANRLKQLILSQDETPLYDRNGNELLRIGKYHVKNIECICVTKETEGVLATDLSLLFDKDIMDEYPYCISMYELRQLAENKNECGITASVFVDYIQKRKYIHGKVFSDDELDLWGYFLKHKGFDNITQQSGDIVPLPLTYSSVFRDAYLSRRQYDSSCAEK